MRKANVLGESMELSSILKSLRQASASRGVSLREIQGGIAVEFEDGSDAYFIHEHNAEAILAKFGALNNPAEAILAEFKALNEKRCRVLTALRHYAVSKGIALDRSRTGTWGARLPGGIGLSINAGPNLTRRLANSQPVDAFLALLEDSYFQKVDRAEAERLVDLQTPPERELRHDEIKETGLLGLGGVEFFAFDCSIPEKQLNTASPEDLAEAVTRPGRSPGFAVLVGLVKKIGEDRLSVPLLNCRVAEFDYADRYDEYKIIPQGNHIAKLITQLGIEGAVESIASEYQRMDRARSRFLRGLKSILASKGLHLDEDFSARRLWFGSSHREIALDPGKPLTRLLKIRNESEALADWLAEKVPSLSVSDEDISVALDGPAVELKRLVLPDTPTGSESPLPSVESLDLAELDRVAAQIITSFKGRALEDRHNRGYFGIEAPLYWWSNPLWYRRGEDNWAEESWWTELARAAWRTEQNTTAAFILMINGDDSPRQFSLSRLQEFEGYPYHELDDALAWHFRDELSYELDEMELGEFPRALGMRPPALIRRDAMLLRSSIRDFHENGYDRGVTECASRLTAVEAADWLLPEEIEEVHGVCIRWSQSTDSAYSLIQSVPIIAAANFGWTDILPSLEKNIVFTRIMFERGTAQDHVGELALALTLLGSGSLAARFAAFAMLQNPEATRKRTEAELTASNSRDHSVELGIIEAHVSRMNILRIAGAVAWTRCRSAGLPGETSEPMGGGGPPSSSISAVPC